MAFNPPRTNCKNCGKPELYPRQPYCQICFKEHRQIQYKERQLLKAAQYPSVGNYDGEVWIELEEEPGYALSNYGRAKSLNYRKQKRESLVALSEARKGGYLKLDVSKHKEERKMFLVHRLVAKYFVGNPNPSEFNYVLHKDENKQNNKWDNLKWGTLSQNRIDYLEHIGQQDLKRKTLTDEEIIEIYNSKETGQDIAIKYNIQPSTVWMIKTGYRRSSVTGAKNTDKRHIKK